MGIFRYSKLRGDTLIEVIMALSVAVVILTAITVVTVNSLRNSTQASFQDTAVLQAKNGIEIVKGMHNEDYNAFKTLPDAVYCLADTCQNLSAAVGACGEKVGLYCEQNVENNFVREVTLDEGSTACTPNSPLTGATYTRVVSSVYWQDSACDTLNPYCHKSEIEACIVNNPNRSSL